MQAYLNVTAALAQIAEQLGLSFNQSEIGVHTLEEVEYRGWWTIDDLSSLGDIVPLGITRDVFLDRAVDVVILWESVKEAPVRNILLRLGLNNKQLGGLKTIKLLGTLCQLAKSCKDGGYRWPNEASHIVAGWDPDLRIPALRRLFAVNELRIKAAHRTGAGFADSLANNLAVFGIVAAAQAGGWGRAVDSVYDGLIEDFTAIATLLTPHE